MKDKNILYWGVILCPNTLMPSLKPKQLDKANPVAWEPSEDKPKGKELVEIIPKM